MKWVHCNSHGAVHSYTKEEDPWCTAVKLDGKWAYDCTHLNYNGDDVMEAMEEAKERGLWLYFPRNAI